ncbi:-; -; Gfo/Idh/MocA family oxidoreductase; Gfo/Idh/MocA family oxidoreductase [Sphingomonas sp. PvP056]|uniref:Gfo/Idh/MocA family protein n=1 Tax=Sphingomonas sp. PvP056 TaxID=3156392 RepID=UPI001205D2B1|nr:Gfo/Idh/MocA family oxidoreductase [Sphingomonas sp. PsM26]RZM32703.1 MAG: Gfo/Idh/MocA family oxidoreductase [Sphingomonas sp.]
MRTVAIIGTGFVADLYAASLRTFPDIQVVACYDKDAERLQRFCAHWQLPAVDSIDAVLTGPATLVLNLTNPHAHFEVSRQLLEAGKHVYSEKPLSMRMEDAVVLHALAKARGLQIASAPCSLLSEAAQTLRLAVEQGRIGVPKLVYAELDDDYISQAPLTKWKSESGTPWPIEDELVVGCTLEHAGYYLTWLMAMFGPVRTTVSASAGLADVSGLTSAETAPDYSSATLFFESGVVARLTCSILAPHDHRIRVIGDRGVASVTESWDNRAAVKVRTRHVIRRRMINSPIARKVPSPAFTRHPAVKRRGAASMNFMLGPAEMLDAIAAGREARQAGDFALHLTEVSLAIQSAGENTGAQHMTTRFTPSPVTHWAGQRTSVQES